MDDRSKIEVNIKQSINTDTIEEDFKNFGDDTAPLLENTGIERDGGVTNLYLTEETYSELGQHVITEDGKTISVIDSTTPNYKVIKIDNKVLGQVSSYGVEKTIEISGVNDIFLTSNSYVTCSLAGNVITVTEYDYAEQALNTRSISFTNLTQVLTFFTSLSFVRWQGQVYTDSLEWSLRLGDQVVILQESDPGISVVKALQTTSVLGTNAINAVVIYNNQLIVAGVGGRIGSYDGNNWRNYDASGTGVGIYNDGNATTGVIGSNDILCMTTYSYGGYNYLVVGGNGGRVGSYNGFTWNKWNSAAAISNNATAISTDNVTAMIVWRNSLVIGGHLGKIGSWNGTAWTLYTGAAGTLSDNATVIGAVSINSFCIYSIEETDILCVAGASGRIGSMRFTTGTFTEQNLTFGGTQSLGMNFGVWVLGDLSAGGKIATSTNGTTWNVQTLTGFTGSAYLLSVFSGVWILRDSGGPRIATSTNGITWNVQTLSGFSSQAQSLGMSFGVWVLGDTGGGGRIATSTNGINWTTQIVPEFTGTVSNLSAANPSIIYNVWILKCVSNAGKISTSTDGINWTTQTLLGWTGSFSAPITVSHSSLFSCYIITSTSEIGKVATTQDGINWIIQILSGFTGFASLIKVINYNYILVDSGEVGKIATTQDGINWTIQILSGFTGLPSSISLINTLYDKGGGGRIATSNDGITWSLGIIPQFTGTTISHVGSINNKFIISDSGGIGRVSTSADGITWTTQTLSGWTGSLLAVASSDNLIVIRDGSGIGKIATFDGTTWNVYSLTSFTGRVSFTSSYKLGVFIMCDEGSGGRISTSIDGITWTTQIPSTFLSISLSSIHEDDGILILPGDSSKYSISNDGINWSSGVFSSGSGTVGYLGYNFNTIVIRQTSTGLIRTAPVIISKKLYTSQTLPSCITNNSTVLGTNAINVMTEYQDRLIVAGDRLIVAGVGGRLGSFLNGVWTNYNVAGLSDDGTNIGSTDIRCMYVYNNILVIAGASGRMASMSLGLYDTIVDTIVESTATPDYIYEATDTPDLIMTIDSFVKYPYNGITGIANNGTIIGTGNINALTEYQGSLIVAGASSTINSMSSSGSFTPFYNAGGISVSNLLTGFNSLGYLYTYRYENGHYLINLVGNSLDKSYTLNNSTKDINILLAKYCLPQISNGLTRHITTADDKGYARIYDASNIKVTGFVGYTDFINYSGVIIYPAAAYTLGNGNVLQSQAGWSYTDFTFRLASSATNVYTHTPQFQANTSGLYQVIQSNTNTLINAYGKLSNNVGVQPSVPFEFRAGWTSGVQSYFSAALLDGYATDSLGVLITNIGEIDDFYQPQIKDDNKLLYTYNNKFIIKKLGTSITQRVQQIDGTLYKINTLSPLNVIDTTSNVLELGSIDFNNRMLFSSVAAPSTSSTKVASVIEGKYCNSIDTGEKLVTISSLSSSDIEVLGYRIPVVSTSVRDYSVSTYINSIYSFSTLNDASELIISSEADTIYAATTIIPVAQGSVYNNSTISSGGSTIFLKPDYDGYSIGNDIPGTYNTFTLFGQLYLYDQKNIYAADVDQVNGIFNTKTLLTSAPGLKYIASSPTAIYFLSTFDNSIYLFNGGRTLDKFKRMNQLTSINSGVFNTRDNTLVLDTDDTFIWVRDNIITQNNKLSTQTNLKYYDTVNGIIIGNDVSSWRYTYEQGTSVVPLSIQLPYYGFNTDEKSILSEWTITIYSESKEKIVLDGIIYSITENDAKEQLVSWTINPVDYYNGGYARIRVQPQVQRSLGTSLKLSTDSKIVLVSVIANFKKGENAPVAGSRSR